MGPSRPRGWTGHPGPGWKEGRSGEVDSLRGLRATPQALTDWARGPVLRAGLPACRLRCLPDPLSYSPEFSAWGRANACVDCWRKEELGEGGPEAGSCAGS